MLKEMLRLDTFYSVPDSSLMWHKDYPPFASLWEYLYCRLAGGYEEAYAYRALHLLELSLFFPAICASQLFKRISPQSLATAVGLPMLILLVLTTMPRLSPTSTDGLLITIYTDILLGLFIALALWCALVSNGHLRFVGLAIVLSAMLLTKQMGIAFYALALGGAALRYCLKKLAAHGGRKHLAACAHNLCSRSDGVSRLVVARQHGQHESVSPLRGLATLVIAAVAPIAFQQSWEIYISQFDLTKQFDLSAIDLSTVMGIVAGLDGATWQQTTASLFIDKTLTGELITLWGIPVSYTLLCGTLILLVCVASWALRHQLAILGSDVIAIAVCTIIGAFGYAISMLLLYVFCFGEIEGPALASYSRYLGTYTLALFSLFCMVLFTGTQRKPEGFALYVCLFALSLILAGSPLALSLLVPALNAQHTNVVSSEQIEYLKTNIDNNERLFVVSQDGNGAENVIISYYLCPNVTNVSNYSFGATEGRTHATLEEFEEILSEYDFLYFSSSDKEFSALYGSLFDIEPQTGYLYRIDHTGNGIRCETIGNAVYP